MALKKKGGSVQYPLPSNVSFWSRILGFRACGSGQCFVTIMVLQFGGLRVKVS